MTAKRGRSPSPIVVAVRRRSAPSTRSPFVRSPSPDQILIKGPGEASFTPFKSSSTAAHLPTPDTDGRGAPVAAPSRSPTPTPEAGGSGSVKKGTRKDTKKSATARARELNKVRKGTWIQYCKDHKWKKDKKYKHPLGETMISQTEAMKVYSLNDDDLTCLAVQTNVTFPVIHAGGYMPRGSAFLHEQVEGLAWRKRATLDGIDPSDPEILKIGEVLQESYRKKLDDRRVKRGLKPLPKVKLYNLVW